MQTTRRRFLTGAAATAVASALPLSVQKAVAAAVPPGGLESVEHVVFLMQENRSFDHYYGTLSGVRGFGDRNAIKRPNGKSVFEQPGFARDVLPFSIRNAIGFNLRPKSAQQFVAGLPHSWQDAQAALGNGWNDRWVHAKTPGTMAYYDRQDLPFQYELADTFTLCDAYHCSLPGGTNPNRMFHWGGNVGYEPDGKRTTGNDAYADTHPGYKMTPYADRLEAAGKTWRVFHEWDDFDDNALEYFESYRDLAKKALAFTTYRSMNAFYGAVGRAGDPVTLLGRLEQGYATLTDAEKSAFDNGLRRTQKGNLGKYFREEAHAGRLPNVSYVVAPAAESEHPLSSAPGRGSGITYDILDAIASDPELWASTIVFITYDENDGFFDHVPPPAPPAGTPGEFVDGKPLGLGTRVPMLVVSPWTVGGFVCSEVFDHTSTIRFVETWLGVHEPNISPWRRRVAGDLTSAFDFARPRSRRAVGRPAPDPGAQTLLPALPPVFQKAPLQEPGHRPARPLAYRTEASARLDGTTLTLALKDEGARGSHFIAYPYADEFPAPRHYDVQGTATVALPVTDEYSVTLIGPNGFRREFTGTVTGKASTVGVSSGQNRRTLVVTLQNPTSEPLTFKVKALAYNALDETIALAPGASETLRHRTADGWYDLAITIAEDAAFTRRLMGHLEDGRPSITA